MCFLLWGWQRSNASKLDSIVRMTAMNQVDLVGDTVVCSGDWFDQSMPKEVRTVRVYYGLMGKSCNLALGCHSTTCSSWHGIEQETLLPHKLSSLLLVVEWHHSAKSHDLPVRP